MTSPDFSVEIDQLRRLIVRLSRLVEISVTLNSTLEVDRLLQFIIRSAADLVNCDAASILLLDDRSQELYCAAATDLSPDEIGDFPVPKEGSIVGTVFREDRALILNDVAIDSSHYQHIREPSDYKIHSLIAVPLRIREQVTGVLEAVNKRQGVFDEMDLQILTNIASQAAVAINNARLVEAMATANEELGILDKLKSDFIAIASHELRTPLGLILGNAALMKESADEEIAEYAEAVLSSAMRMRGLIEDMTNLNMLQMGSAELMLSLEPLQPILTEALEMSEEIIATKDLNLFSELPEEPIYTMVDGTKISMAVTNLIHNSARFTPPGGEVHLGLEVHGREAWIRVRDTGVGIPADQFEPIFDQFYQVEDHLTRRHDGMGLGLPIVRAIAVAHAGRVWVESEGEGQGAVFTISLPLASE